jgi:hypothetical protein
MNIAASVASAENGTSDAKKKLKKSWDEFLSHIYKNEKNIHYLRISLLILVIIIVIAIIIIVVVICIIIYYATNCKYIINGQCCKYGISPNSIKCNESVKCKNDMRSTSGKCCTNGLTKNFGIYCNESCDVKQGSPVRLSNNGACCKYGVTDRGNRCFRTLCTTELDLKARVHNSCICLYGLAPNGDCAHKCTKDGSQIETLLSYSGKCCNYGQTVGLLNDGINKYFCKEKCTKANVEQYNNVTDHGICCSLGIAKNNYNCNKWCGNPNYSTTVNEKKWTFSGRCCEYGAAPGKLQCNSSEACNADKISNNGRCCEYGITEAYGNNCNAKCANASSVYTSRGMCCPDGQIDGNDCPNKNCGQAETYYYTSNSVRHYFCCNDNNGVNENGTGCNRTCDDGTLSAGGICCKSGLTTYNVHYNVCNSECCTHGQVKTLYGSPACAHDAKGACCANGFAKNNNGGCNRTTNTPLLCTVTTQFNSTGLCCKGTYPNGPNKGINYYQGVASNGIVCNIPCGDKSYNTYNGSCTNCPNGLTTAKNPPKKCMQDCGCYNNTASGNCTIAEVHNKTNKGRCCATGLAICQSGNMCMEKGCAYNYGTYSCNNCYRSTTGGEHSKHGNFCGFTRYGKYVGVSAGGKCYVGGIFPSQWK